MPVCAFIRYFLLSLNLMRPFKLIFICSFYVERLRHSQVKGSVGILRNLSQSNFFYVCPNRSLQFSECLSYLFAVIRFVIKSYLVFSMNCFIFVMPDFYNQLYNMGSFDGQKPYGYLLWLISTLLDLWLVIVSFASIPYLPFILDTFRLIWKNGIMQILEYNTINRTYNI